MAEVVEKLDDWGLPAWIAVMVLGFVVFFPVGLIVLAYLIWSGRMGCGKFGNWSGEDRRERMERKMMRLQEKMERWTDRNRQWRTGFSPSGNRAFDEYRAETLKRLEEEANEFKSFLERLRHAKDKAEFDQFMSDRRSGNPDQGTSPGGSTQG